MRGTNNLSHSTPTTGPHEHKKPPTHNVERPLFFRDFKSGCILSGE